MQLAQILYDEAHMRLSFHFVAAVLSGGPYRLLSFSDPE